MPGFDLVGERLPDRPPLRRNSRGWAGSRCGVPLDALEPPRAPPLQPSSLRQVRAWMQMNWRSLPYILKLKQPCTGFRNFDVSGESVAGTLQP